MKKKYLNLLVLFSFIIGLIPLASCSDPKIRNYHPIHD
jgi:hypothetical protein